MKFADTHYRGFCAAFKTLEENLEEFSSWWRGRNEESGQQGWWSVWPPVQLLECTELANQPLTESAEQPAAHTRPVEGAT